MKYPTTAMMKIKASFLISQSSNRKITIAITMITVPLVFIMILICEKQLKKMAGNKKVFPASMF